MSVPVPASVALSPDERRVLDNPAWYSLTGPHARFAQSIGAACRYDPDVSVFAALPDEQDAQSWHDLAQLVGPGVTVAISGAIIDVPRDWDEVHRGTGLQLIDASVDAAPDDEAVLLGSESAAEMAQLVARAQPGPWRPRTYTLGSYLGIRRDDRLVAMAGERLHPPGWTEISAVCTDPAYRGLGLAGRLVRAVAHNIRARGEKVLLHTAATNTSAIRLYYELGFQLRRETTFAAYRSPEERNDD